MASFTKFYSFTEALAEKVHNLGSDQLKIALTNTLPSQSNTQLSNITEISYTNLSSRNVTTSSSSQTSGTYKLVCNDLVLTASGAVATFRYVVLYNDTATNDELIAFADYGASVTLANLDTFTIDFDGTNGVLTIAQKMAIVFRSDCISIADSHDCSVLISYTNTDDFDNLLYSDPSPNTTFNVRIPAVFFEEENPQEQEDLELSNGVIVTLRQSIVEKRKLETGFMPNYMHRKLQKILMHDSVYIDGDYWKKRDSYDTSPVKKYNLKTASVFLTKYDSVEKNTI